MPNLMALPNFTFVGYSKKRNRLERWRASWVKHLPAPANSQLLNEAQQTMPLQWRSRPVNPPLLSPMNRRATIQSSVMTHRRQRQEPASATSKFEAMAMLEPQNKKVLMEVSVKTVKSILNRQQLKQTERTNLLIQLLSESQVKSTYQVRIGTRINLAHISNSEKSTTTTSLQGLISLLTVLKFKPYSTWYITNFKPRLTKLVFHFFLTVSPSFNRIHRSIQSTTYYWAEDESPNMLTQIKIKMCPSLKNKRKYFWDQPNYHLFLHIESFSGVWPFTFFLTNINHKQWR